MKLNMGTVDRVIRTLLAIVIAILYFTNVIAGTLGLVLGVVAVVMLLTGVISFCPIYAMLGLSTRAGEAPAAPKP
jgi:Inner membrane protein YgaP-like, transmembrane domain